MKPITFDKLCYRIDDQPTYLYSGEFHYFRVPKADWRRRMQLFKDAGGNAIATYVPWLIHEPTEGDIRFGDVSYRDLEGFLQTAQEMGLYVIARPGPYQYSELKYDGLPGWLCEGYPELRAQTIAGSPFRVSSISYLHPLFLEKVHTWFSNVCPLIARYTVSRGGPVAFTQIDNEMTGIHLWFGSLDYNATTFGFGQPEGRYTCYLRQKYADIGALNAAYETSFATFEAVRPVLPASGAAPAHIRRARDYFDFYLSTIAEYAQILTAEMRQFGIDTPIVHNSANPSMNAHFCETAAALGKSFLLGSDHYYTLDQNWPQNNPTPQYAVNVFCSNEMLRLMGYPPTVFELPGGSLSDWPPVTPHDAKTCYLTNLALGMKGSNYYIYTGGPNAPGTGVTADVYDYGASVGPFGDTRPLYQVQKDFGRLLAERPWLAEAQHEFDCRVALDFEHVRAENYWKDRGDALFANCEAYDFLRKGVLSTAFCASLSPALCDLGADDWLADTQTPVIIVAPAGMARQKQERVVKFLQRGGSVLITPILPALDEHLQPCTLLSDFLGSPVITANTSQFTRITVDRVVNIWNNGDCFLTSRLPAGAKVIGIDEISGSPVAWRQTIDKGGQAIVLGLRWYHAKREHEQMLRALLLSLGVKQKVDCSNPNVWTSLRTSGTRSMLFIMNLLSSPMEARVDCRPSWSEGILETGNHELGPMSVETFEIE
ncbi:MAG TPA: beta-galactosidase [Anaerolineae bacterium]|jgi:beta-galactosidase